ncbi:ribonuclease HIII [Candidatus Mycoplasma haematominutum]|uniref:Ribonuclease n=1 Tax=Candidatus Mycoplasma haematominutum 'Birmingham 1' TaxID=1116213 RepID=G8C3B8_9MOLU|nr:ribonuclease HIII [Candidatus Mycoplasma haematominutum]CCE66816.1 ribonuclease HIII [Candidatus Mycoplasma haematominutum 'Birmingham 1']
MRYSFTEAEAASDESGKGDFFGGLHISLTYLDSEGYILLKNENILQKINDSKLLSDATVYYLAPKLQELLDWRILSISFEISEYNRIYEKFQNINLLLSYGHNLLWEKLEKLLREKGKLFPPKTIVDQFCTAKKYYQHLESINIEGINLTFFETKAEQKYLSCAISSIISRYLFLEEVDKLSKSLDYELPLGASSAVVRAFGVLHRKRGFKAEQYCKTHFKTLEEAKRLPSA